MCLFLLTKSQREDIIKVPEFKESEHPRDEDGKFTSKNGNSKSRYKRLVKAIRKRIEHKRANIQFFARKQKSDKAEKRISNEEAKDYIPVDTFGFEGDRLYTQHHMDHAIEMGFKDQKQYQRAAIEFWKSGRGKLFFNKSLQRYYKYDEKTSRFISVGVNGQTHTFMLLSNKKFQRKVKQDFLYGL